MGNQVTPFVRQQVIGYDARVAGQSVVDLCRRLGISTSSFYRIRARARAEGTAAALTARSRAPRNPVRRWGKDADAEITRLRAELIGQGREAGPWSVWWVMSAGGTLPAPSRATIARRLRAMGLVTPAPRKRPRVSYKRFTRTAANELWQIDGIQWVLDGRLVTIYQVIDDCSRLLVGLRACVGGERADDAQALLADAFEAWGAPAAVLSDNGTAFNTHRTIGVGSTEKWLAARGGCAPSPGGSVTPRPRARSSAPTSLSGTGSPPTRPRPLRPLMPSWTGSRPTTTPSASTRASG